MPGRVPGDGVIVGGLWLAAIGRADRLVGIDVLLIDIQITAFGRLNLVILVFLADDLHVLALLDFGHRVGLLLRQAAADLGDDFAQSPANLSVATALDIGLRHICKRAFRRTIFSHLNFIPTTFTCAPFSSFITG